MTQISYIVGDATSPVGVGKKIIAHICNDVGAWGAGFVTAISRRWPEPEAAFRGWRGILGEVQFVKVDPDIVVANIIGQHGLDRDFGRPPIRYDAVRQGLRFVANQARTCGASIHMPRIGCGLAGGTWNEIEPIIHDELAGLSVTVYDLPK